MSLDFSLTIGVKLQNVLGERCLVRKPSAGGISTMTRAPAALLRGGEERSSIHQLHDLYMASKEVVQGGGLKRPEGGWVLQNLEMD